ncbi:MAG: TetR/AcrR family transcriptional regulator, partial [Syntrophomonadaceae bacterium]|nr:TetR/AcrR family transcriptional regulator [Syntrophomonadaceae bacterium]
MAQRERSERTRQRIVQATLDLIAGEGLEKVTVRKIAAAAQVNLAAVNYHFGSKDAAVNEALKVVTSRLQVVFRRLGSGDQPAAIRLQDFLSQVFEILCNFPEVTRHMVNQSFRGTPVVDEYRDFLRREGIPLVTAALAEVRPEYDQARLRARALQLLSALSFPVLMRS